MLSTAFDSQHPLVNGHPPAWASGWGQDRFGVFVEITVEGVTQRMRWIPKGSFNMGSPEDEQGRRDNEGPQHQVIISNGYWLFDTPVTQALWLVVMGGENPSRFQHPKRPVEHVNWAEAQQFIERINETLPGVKLRLPTETQWEYACRAGSKRATWGGDLEIRGERNAPTLNEIAWYGGNSGEGFDLDEGWDTSDWKEQQFYNRKAGTRIVAQKKANPWGLYDMLGNVWEWCADDQREYCEADEQDPVGPVDGDERIVRGGSWDCVARDCRAAYRAAYRLQSPRDYRDCNFGFRCARGKNAVSPLEPGEAAEVWRTDNPR